MEADTIAVIGMWVTIIGMILWQSSRHDTKIDALDTKIDTKIDALDTKFDTKIDALDTKFDKEFKAVHGEFKQVRREMAGQGERLARIEGHLMGPESFTSGPPSPDEPAGDHRQAG